MGRGFPYSRLYGLAVAAFVLGMFYYWFGVADRYAVFLYGHLGAMSFDRDTSSRYWMTGLVADGMVLTVGMFLSLLLRQFAPAYLLLGWPRAWLSASLLLIVGVPAITMTVNHPVLPVGLALACAVVASAGLAPALMLLEEVGRDVRQTLYLMAEGTGVSALLFTCRVAETPLLGLQLGVPAWAIYVVSGGIVAGSLTWLFGLGLIRRKLGWKEPELWKVSMAGLALLYLMLPLAHHLFETPAEYRYISTASNFFLSRVDRQTLAFLATGALTLCVYQVRKRWFKD